MFRKIKEYVNEALAILVLVLGILFVRERGKREKAESDLAGSEYKRKVETHEQKQQQASQNADEAESRYRDLKRKYESESGNDAG